MSISFIDIANGSDDLIAEVLNKPEILVSATIERYPSNTDTKAFHTPEILNTQLPPEVKAAMDRLIDYIETTDAKWTYFDALRNSIGGAFVRYDDDNRSMATSAVQDSDAQTVHELISKWGDASEQPEQFPTNAMARMNIYLLERFFELHEDEFRQVLIRDNTEYHHTMAELQSEGVGIPKARKMAAYQATTIVPVFQTFIQHMIAKEAGKDVGNWDMGVPLMQ